MATFSENDIRDVLSTQLDVIEAGLTLVDTNFLLPNTKGSKGFVDILARDASGLLVVIELKRSDNTAREAIHEVLKYAGLLSRERGVPTSELRAMIVSTSWRELLVPFSLAVRTTDFELQGMELQLDQDEETAVIESVSLVSPLDVKPERRLTTVRLEVEVAAEDDPQELFCEIAISLSEFGVDDCAGVVVAHDDGTQVMFLGLGPVVPGDPRGVEKIDADRYEDIEDSKAAESDPGQSVSELAEREAGGDSDADTIAEQRALVGALAGLPLGRPSSVYRIGRVLQQDCWARASLFRGGAFEREGDLLPDEKLLAMIDGTAGGSEIQFAGAARPSHSTRWATFRTRCAFVLVGNPRWSETLSAWLHECEGESNINVEVSILNPLDFLGSFVFGGTIDPEESLPSIEGIRAVPAASALREARLIHGTLMWDGSSGSIAEVFREVFSSTEDWWLRRATGGLWEADLEFTDALGLVYELVEFEPGDGPAHLLSYDGVSLKRTASGPGMSWPGRRSVRELLEGQAVEFDELLDRLGRGMSPPDARGDVAVVLGP